MTPPTAACGPPDSSSWARGHAPRWPGLAALSLLALALWAARAAVAGPRFGFLGWNLFLAWVPWGLSLALSRRRGALGFWVLAAAWLAFFPNAPYLVTDLVHLKARAPVPLWFDVLFLATFAWAGCFLGWDSLERVHGALRGRLGAPAAAWAVAACVALCGVGVFLGRFERLNSWEVVTAPREVLLAAAAALREPRALVFSGAFAAFVGVGYLTGWNKSLSDAIIGRHGAND